MSCISFIHYRIIHLLAYICLNHISEFKYIQLCHGSPQERLGLTRIPMEEVRSGHWNSNLVFHLYLIEMKWRHGYLTSKVAKVKPSWTSVGSDDPLNFFILSHIILWVYKLTPVSGNLIIYLKLSQSALLYLRLVYTVLVYS